MAPDSLGRRSPARSSCRFVLLSTILVIATATHPADAEIENRETPSAQSETSDVSERGAATGSALDGIQLVYRFASGRTYRVAYGFDDVTFELLEPRLDPPPGKTMPYAIQTLRPDLHLVVWMDPEFHTTFVIDLERRRVHASALRDREGLFVATAEIIEIARPSKKSMTR